MGNRELRSRPTLDLESARIRLAGNEQLLTELAQFLADDASGLLDVLADAIDGGDGDRAAQAVHRLRNLAAGFLAEPTTALASGVEAAVRSGKLAEAGRMQPELRRQFGEIVGILRETVLRPP